MKDCASIRKYDGSAFDPKGWPWETILTFKAWGLVMRTREGSEFWKDLQTGVIWLKPWPDAMDRESAEIFCGLLGDSTVWDDPARLGTEWALPSKSDYRTAESHGIRRVLNLWPGDLFWTSSLTGWTSEPLVFDQRTGDTHNDLRPDRQAFVQCVLR
jgi:hypothetical protein